ncbi:MAG: 2Fe-2S iron-sulfur cluster binding domain-containing protein [Bacteroidetes bacterium]|nr:2Fe-2S iron-sulfur cluster binding domain-containing protein [Bacteroidota bacterium]
MPQIIIDGKAYAYEGQHKLLPFALEQGVEIPYFCWHPAMSAPTNCRMCLVEVGFPVKNRETGELERDEQGEVKVMWGRKPATSCNQDLVPDMVVRTASTSPEIKKAQEGVLEFILGNHPLDCPICDQAGECPLQINTYKFGPEGSRFELNKVHKPKRIALGPRVTLDAERCINCTRCTRFTEEISKTNQLSIVNRGELNFPSAGPGKTFDDHYSMNTVDICPVGALTSTDFRFKARVWEMNYTPNVCTGCSKACSIDVWVRDNEVMRITPRENKRINDYWMCDNGRLDYMRYNLNRVSGIKLQDDIPVPHKDGLTQAADLLARHRGRVLFVGSGYSSLENNYVLQQLAAHQGVNEVVYLPEVIPGIDDGFLRKDDRLVNHTAIKMLGFVPLNDQEMQARIQQAGLVVVMEDNRVADLAVKSGKSTLVLATNYFEGANQAAMILPAATHFEMAGTYINCDNVPQLSMQAKQVRQMTPEMWMAMPKSRLDAGGVAIDNWRNPDHIVDCLPSWLMLNAIAALLGLELPYSTHKELYTHLKHKYADALSGLELPRRNRKESFKQSQFEFAIG